MRRSTSPSRPLQMTRNWIANHPNFLTFLQPTTCDMILTTLELLFSGRTSNQGFLQKITVSSSYIPCGCWRQFNKWLSCHCKGHTSVIRRSKALEEQEETNGSALCLPCQMHHQISCSVRDASRSELADEIQTTATPRQRPSLYSVFQKRVKSTGFFHLVFEDSFTVIYNKRMKTTEELYDFMFFWYDHSLLSICD